MNKKHLLIFGSLIAAALLLLIAISSPLQQKTPQHPTDNNDNGDNGNGNTSPPSTNNTTQYPPTNNTTNPPSIPRTYNTSFSFDQATEKLNQEVEQYRIVFVNNTTITATMAVSYTMQTGPIYYLVYLTDGTNNSVISLGNERFKRLIDFTIKKERGLGRLTGNLSDNKTISFTKDIPANTTYYLTVAVWKHENETITVSINAGKPCINATRLDRTGNVTLLSAAHGDFNKGKIIGRYHGFKILNFGLSFYNINKQFTPNNSNAIVCAQAHNLGFQELNIYADSYSFVNYNIGNLSMVVTGLPNGSVNNSYKIESRGFNLLEKTSLLVFVVDVNPYSRCYINDANRDKGDTANAFTEALKTAIVNVIETLGIAAGYLIVGLMIIFGIILLFILKSIVKLFSLIKSILVGLGKCLLGIIKVILKNIPKLFSLIKSIFAGLSKILSVIIKLIIKIIIKLIPVIIAILKAILTKILGK